MNAHLSPNLRRQLARAIQAARRAAEEGACKALAGLAVGTRESHDGRPRRSVSCGGGSARTGGSSATVATAEPASRRLTGSSDETAYEHWHRMLFARFLAVRC